MLSVVCIQIRLNAFHQMLNYKKKLLTIKWPRVVLDYLTDFPHKSVGQRW